MNTEPENSTRAHGKRKGNYHATAGSFKKGEAHRFFGKRSHNYKGGHIDKKGYLHIWVKIDGIKVRRQAHRYIMELHLGRALNPMEVVHHKNGNVTDNQLSNLELMPFGKHTILHHLGVKNPKKGPKTNARRH